jgi:hypothetical protein
MQAWVAQLHMGLIGAVTRNSYCTRASECTFCASLSEQQAYVCRIHITASSIKDASDAAQMHPQ